MLKGAHVSHVLKGARALHMCTKVVRTVRIKYSIYIIYRFNVHSIQAYRLISACFDSECCWRGGVALILRRHHNPSLRVKGLQVQNERASP